jgi:hypothetical protein
VNPGKRQIVGGVGGPMQGLFRTDVSINSAAAVVSHGSVLEWVAASSSNTDSAA